jgi:hypothetical protein
MRGCVMAPQRRDPLRVYLPPVQQVSCSAHSAAGSGSPAALTLLARRSGQPRAHAHALRATGPCWLRRDRARIGERKQARSGAPLSARRSPAHAGARGHPRRASSMRGGRSGAGTMKAGSAASAEGARSASPELAATGDLASAGTIRQSLSHTEQAQCQAEHPPPTADRRIRRRLRRRPLMLVPSADRQLWAASVLTISFG